MMKWFVILSSYINIILFNYCHFVKFNIKKENRAESDFATSQEEETLQGNTISQTIFVYENIT